jgi:hypothetical protein
MGRRSKLKGDKARAIAREFGIAESTIRERFSDEHRKVKDVANQLVTAESALKALPISAQISALNLAEELKAISSHLAGAAKYGAATAHRLSGIAHAKVQLIDDAAPLDEESMESLKGVAVLTRMANDASVIPMSLLSANREAVKALQDAERPTPQRVMVTVEDASIPAPDA